MALTATKFIAKYFKITARKTQLLSSLMLAAVYFNPLEKSTFAVNLG